MNFANRTVFTQLCLNIDGTDSILEPILRGVYPLQRQSIYPGFLQFTASKEKRKICCLTTPINNSLHFLNILGGSTSSVDFSGDNQWMIA